MKRWEFTGETKLHCDITLRRIRATMDFTLKCGFKVSKWDNGGWIEKEGNLYDNAWVFGDAWVYGNARVSGNAMVSDNARVSGNAMVSDNAWVYGDARVSGDAEVYGDARVFGNAWVYGNAMVSDNAWVSGNAMVSGDACVSGNAMVSGKTDILWFKNCWSSGRRFTYTRSNKKWAVGCFYGTGDELIAKAYKDSELSGKCYEATVKYVEQIYAAIDAGKSEEAN